MTLDELAKWIGLSSLDFLKACLYDECVIDEIGIPDICENGYAKICPSARRTRQLEMEYVSVSRQSLLIGCHAKVFSLKRLLLSLTEEPIK